jgi:hypothetical protein
MAGDFLDLPFDQYQRYTLARAFADAVRSAPDQPLKVLDVGGYPGLMIDFLPMDDVTVVDMIDAEIPNYVRASGAELPFPDASFDLVCTCDTLEHVPEGSRPAFLNELARVSKEFIFLTAPFDDDRTRLAEEILYSYVDRVLRTDFVTLREHIDNGLPPYEETIDQLQAAGLKTAGFPSGYLYNWLPMMLAKHHLMAHGDTEALHRRVDRFYNLNFSPDDFREPSYRRVIVGSKSADRRIEDYALPYTAASDGAQVESDFGKLEAFRLLSGLLDHDLKRDVGRLVDQLRETTEGELKEARAALVERDRQITDLTSIIQAQNESLDELHALVSRVRNFWPYRIYTRARGRR